MKVLAVLVAACSVGAWDYTKSNQKVWGDSYKYCAGEDQDNEVFVNRQSPINIPTKKKKLKGVNFFMKDKYLPNVDLYDAASVDDVKVTNNGKFVRISGFRNKNKLYKGGLVLDDYELSHVDVHFPSEHRLNGKEFDGEFQLFFNRASEGSGFGTSTVAVSTFFDKGSQAKDNSVSDFFESLGKIQQPGSSTSISTFQFTDLLTKDSLKKYYAYEGLTTYPPCDTSVTWLIGSKKMTVSSKQFKKLRLLMDSQSNPMKKQRRRPQTLGARVIYNSFNDGSKKPSFVNYVNNQEQFSNFGV